MKQKTGVVLCILCLLLCVAASASEYDEFERESLTPAVFCGYWTDLDTYHHSGYRDYNADGTYTVYGRKDYRDYTLLDVREDGTAYCIRISDHAYDGDRTVDVSRTALTWTAGNNSIDFTGTDGFPAGSLTGKEYSGSYLFEYGGLGFSKTLPSSLTLSHLLGDWQLVRIAVSNTEYMAVDQPQTLTFRDDYTFAMTAADFISGQPCEGVYAVTDDALYAYVEPLGKLCSLSLSSDSQTLVLQCNGLGYIYARDPQSVSDPTAVSGLAGTYWVGTTYRFGTEETRYGVYFINDEQAIFIQQELSHKRYGTNIQLAAVFSVQPIERAVRLSGFFRRMDRSVDFYRESALYARIEGEYECRLVRIPSDSFVPLAGRYRYASDNFIEELTISPDGSMNVLDTYSEGDPLEYMSAPLLYGGQFIVGIQRYTPRSDGGLNVFNGYADLVYERIGDVEGTPPAASPLPTLPPGKAAPTPTPEPIAPEETVPAASGEGSATLADLLIVLQQAEILPTATAVPVTPAPAPTETARPTAAPTPAPTKTARPTATPTPAPTKTARPTATPTPVTSVGGAGGAANSAASGVNELVQSGSAPARTLLAGETNAYRLTVRTARASSHLNGATSDYSGASAVDGVEGTCWQFSTKKAKLGDVTLSLRLEEASTVNELWLKNGFWRITDGWDQYTRNGRPKQIGVSYRYKGEKEFRDEETVTLRDDSNRKAWQIVPLKARENVIELRIRVISIYTGTKYKTDVALSEVMPVFRDAPAYRKLEKGDSGDAVLEMKLRLQKLGYFDKDANMNDKYNDACVNRVKQFQKVNGLKATGTADRATLTLIFSSQALKKP